MKGEGESSCSSAVFQRGHAGAASVPQGALYTIPSMGALALRPRSSRATQRTHATPGHGRKEGQRTTKRYDSEITAIQTLTQKNESFQHTDSRVLPTLAKTPT